MTFNSRNMDDPVCCLTNENLEFQYGKLASIIEKSNLLDVPIVIYSIAGPERTGKSFLLNVFWHLLKKADGNVSEKETNKQTLLPRIFDHKHRLEAVTRGIYMTTKPIILTKNKTEVAVFLMDTQGINSGDRVECKEGDIFTLSLGLSFMQIVNVEKRLKYPDIDTYAKLMLLVRDWNYTDEYDHGYDEGTKYYGKISQTHSMQKQIECLKSFYAKEECFLMPYPGKEVETPNTKLLSDINEEAWPKFVEFFEIIFSSSNLQEACAVAPKGKDFLQMAKYLEEKLAQRDRLSAPNGCFKDFLDLVMQIKIKKSCAVYRSYMTKFKDKQGNEFQSKHKGGVEIATEALKEKSLIDDMTPHVNSLHELLEKEYERLFEVVMKNQTQECVEFYKEQMKSKSHDEKKDATRTKLLKQNPIEKDSTHIGHLQNDIDVVYETLFDEVMKIQTNQCLEYYKQRMHDCTDLTGSDLKKKHEKESCKAISKLLEENPIQEDSTYIKRLQDDINMVYEVLLKTVIENQIDKCVKHQEELMTDCTHLNGNQLRERFNKTSNETTIKLVRENLIPLNSVYVQRLETEVYSMYETLLAEVKEIQISQSLEYYKQLMHNCTDLTERDLKKKHDKESAVVVSKLLEENPIQEDSTYIKRLQDDMHALYETMFAEVMKIQTNHCLECYKQLMHDCTNLNGIDLKKNHDIKREEATSKLLEQNPIQEDSTYIKRLQDDMHALYETMFAEVMKIQTNHCLECYKQLMHDCTNLNGIDLKKNHDIKREEATSKLLEQNQIQEDSMYIKRLQEHIDAVYEVLFVTVMLNQVDEYLQYLKEVMNDVTILSRLVLGRMNGNHLRRGFAVIRNESTLKLMRENLIPINSVYVQRLETEVYSMYETLFAKVMKIQINQCLEYYKELMQDCTDLNGSDLKKKHDKESAVVVSKLLEENPIQEDSTYIKRLQDDIDVVYEVLLKTVIENQIDECVKHQVKLMNDCTYFNGNQLRERFHKTSNETTLKLMRENLIPIDSVYVQHLHAEVNSMYETLLAEVMKIQINQCLEYYKRLMHDCTDLTGRDLKKKHDKKSGVVISKLLEENPIQEDSSYIKHLQDDMHMVYEIYHGRHKNVEYANKWATEVKQKSFDEEEISKFYLQEGTNHNSLIKKELKSEVSRKVVLEEFNTMMKKKYDEELVRRKTSEEQGMARAVFTGLVVGAGAVLIPPIGVAAAAGIGVAGGAAAGALARLRFKFSGPPKKAPDLRENP